MNLWRTRQVAIKGTACVVLAAWLASSTAPLAASQTVSTLSPAQIAAGEADYVEGVHAGVDGAVEGLVAGGVAGAVIGHFGGAVTGALVGAGAGFVASIVMYMLGHGGDQHELTGLPKGTRLPSTVLD